MDDLSMHGSCSEARQLDLPFVCKSLNVGDNLPRCFPYIAMQAAILSYFLLAVAPSFASGSLLHKSFESVVTALGQPIEDRREGPPAFAGVKVEHFQKDGWVYRVCFEDNRARRIIVFRLDRAALSDQEIRKFFPPKHLYATWKIWSVPSRRAWVLKGGKHPAYYVVLGSDARTLLLVSPYGADTAPDLSEF